MKLLKGKRPLPDSGAADHPAFSPAHSAAPGPASAPAGGQRPGERGSPGSVTAPPEMRPPGAEDRAQRQGCWRNGRRRPVLKHGPRSQGFARVSGRQKPAREMKVNAGESPRAHHRPIPTCSDGFEWERQALDPKDGELCSDRVKPEETLVEARSGSDVQIDRQI